MKNKPGIVGAALGLIVFLFFGLLPSILYGGWTGLIIANGIFGRQDVLNIFSKILVAGGVFFGVIAIGMLSIVMGSILGSLVGRAVRIVGLGLKTAAQEA